MERGESSGSNAAGDDIWAKLVPLDSSQSDIELRSNEVMICSDTKTSLSEKQEWCKITRESDQISAVMLNTSCDSILVDGAVVQKDDETIITCGSEITPGPEADGFMRYMFKVMPTKEKSKKLIKITIDPEHAKCSICLSVWYDVVTVAPCLHNFCNGCFSEWLRRSHEKRSTVLCPQCRAVVQFAGRNHFLHSIEEDILKSDSTLRRSTDEIMTLEAHKSIKSCLVIPGGRKGRKRARAQPNDEIEREFPCPQCGTEYGGFRCSGSTVHLQCEACGGMMPDRSNLDIPQHCIGCDRAFCGAYWRYLEVTSTDAYPLCSHDTLKRIADYSITRLPLAVHAKNRHEQDITEKCIRNTGKSVQGVISEWITKWSNREFERSRIQLNHYNLITPDTHLCRDCYDKFVSYLLYWFRVTLPRSLWPPEALKREDCWYGISCRTQHHNEEHARKRNHVCRPIRGADDVPY